MCGRVDSWVEEGWKPFADLGHDLAATVQRAAADDADADAPLRRDETEVPSVTPGIPRS
jgi:hypothetical protein